MTIAYTWSMSRARKVSTIPLSQKGPAAPRPRLAAPAETLAVELEQWPGVIARAHWEIGDDTSVNGADFYIGEHELGHIHLDGEAHVPMLAAEARALIDAGSAQAFPWSEDWVAWRIRRPADVAVALALFERSLARTRAKRRRIH